jgi:hypothetical protein
MIVPVPPQLPPARPPRAESRQTAELKALRDRRPELAEAVGLHLELLELERRIQGRVPLPLLALGGETLARHAAEARPLLRFEDIPLDLTDLRLMVRQTADILRRFGALDDGDYREIQLLGRDMKLIEVAGSWYRSRATRNGSTPPPDADGHATDMVGQVLAQAMRPFLSRCAEVLQQQSDLVLWTHPYCALCGGEPDFAVITSAAERQLLCSRCSLRWKFEALTCPYCLNGDRKLMTSFGTQDGVYRVDACNVCKRYLKAFDARRSSRPVLPIVDSVATLPLDAAAIQRGYIS